MLGFEPIAVSPLCAYTLLITDDDETTNLEVVNSFLIVTNRELPTVFCTTRTFPEING